MTRSFVAIPMPDAGIANAVRLQTALRLGRAVRPENLHLTLAFLGDVAPAALEELDQALSGISSRPFSLQPAGLGAFGADQPRSVHLNFVASPGLLALHEAVSKAVWSAGLALAHRRFVPHVTLARLKRTPADEVAAAIEAAPNLDWPELQVFGFSLMASTLRPDGPRYDTLGSYPLSNLV